MDEHEKYGFLMSLQFIQFIILHNISGLFLVGPFCMHLHTQNCFVHAVYSKIAYTVVENDALKSSDIFWT